MAVPKEVRERYKKLEASINHYRRLFHVYDKEEISEQARDSLMEELCSWIASHSGDLDASEFARVHHVPSARIEEGLDRLLKGGFIARDG